MSWSHLDPFASNLLPLATSPEDLVFPIAQAGEFRCFAINTVINRDYSRSTFTADVIITVVTW